MHEWSDDYGDDVINALVLGTRADGNAVRADLAGIGDELLSAGRLEDIAFRSDPIDLFADLDGARALHPSLEAAIASRAPGTFFEGTGTNPDFLVERIDLFQAGEFRTIFR